MSTREMATALSTAGEHRLKHAPLLRGNSATTAYHLDWVRCAECLSDEDCDDIIAACGEFPPSSPSTVGEDRYPAHRRASTTKIGLNVRTSWIFDLLCSIAQQAAATAYGLDLTTINRAPQYVEYRPGWGQFDWHNDYSHGTEEAPRKLTIIIQLSNSGEYEGGRLQLFGPELEDLPNQRGSIMAFPSILYHRVTPVSRGVRRALVAWVAGPRIR